MSDPKPLRVNLIIDQGTTFSSNITIYTSNGTIQNTTGWSTANSYIRKNYNSNNFIAFSRSVNSNGILTLSLSSNQTANITYGKYVYDAFCIDANSNFIKVVEGFCFINPSASITQIWNQGNT